LAPRMKGTVNFSDVIERFRLDLASGKPELNSSKFINQQYYAEQGFGSPVANTLIREALRELSSTGCVTYVPNKGFRPLYDYSNLSKEQHDEVMEEIIEVTRIRLNIETRAIALAISHPRHRLILEAGKILEQEKLLMAEQKNASKEDLPKFIMSYINFNNAFHLRLGHEYPKRIIHILNVVYSVFDPYQFRNLKRRQPTSHREHREILESVKRGDEAGSVEKLTTHIIGGAYAALEEIAPAVTLQIDKKNFRQLILKSQDLSYVTAIPRPGGR